MSWLSSFLNPGKGYEKGQEQLNNYYNQAQMFQQPYSQNGMAQYGNLNEIIQNLINPQALQDKWASGYEESQAAKNAEATAQENGLDAASSMGLMGSNTALKAIQQGTSEIGAKDRQNYLNDLLKKYLGAAQLSQGIYGQGANAAGQLGQNAMNMGQESANLAYGQQSAGGNMFSNLLGRALPIAAGFALGGPAGAAGGAGLGNTWSLKGGQ